MRDFNRNNRSGGDRRRGGGDFRRRDSRPREMHRAVCDECGQNCEVPFRPSGDKPIYCSNCFERKDDGGSRRPSRRDSRGSGFAEKDNTNQKILDQLTSLNAKFDRVLMVLESKVEKKPSQQKVEAKKEVKRSIPKDKKSKKKKTGMKVSKKSSRKG